jgi:hypothetical protein
MSSAFFGVQCYVEGHVRSRSLTKFGKDNVGRYSESERASKSIDINKLRGLSPRENYTDRATAACRRSYCQLFFADRGRHVFSMMDPYGSTNTDRGFESHLGMDVCVCPVCANFELNLLVSFMKNSL